MNASTFLTAIGAIGAVLVLAIFLWVGITGLRDWLDARSVRRQRRDDELAVRRLGATFMRDAHWMSESIEAHALMEALGISTGELGSFDVASVRDAWRGRLMFLRDARAKEVADAAAKAAKPSSIIIAPTSPVPAKRVRARKAVRRG